MPDELENTAKTALARLGLAQPNPSDLQTLQIRLSPLSTAGFKNHFAKAFGTPKSTADSDQGEVLTLRARALSAALIQDRFVDFSNEGVLKQAVPMINDIKMYKDHSTTVLGVIGRASNSKWEPATDNLPAGINFDANIYVGSEQERDKDVELARLYRTLNTGLADSFSVGITFMWKPSHNMGTGWLGDFWRNLGTEVDGELVRIVVTEITAVNEISLVWEGADPTAKTLSLGAEVSEQLSKSKEQIDAAKSVITVHEQTIEQLTAQNKDLTAQLEKAKAELSAKNEAIATYRQDVVERIRTAGILSDQLAMLGDNFGQFLETQPMPALLQLCHNIEASADKKLPLKCNDCGSTNVERRSSVQAQADKKPETPINPEDYNFFKER